MPSSTAPTSPTPSTASPTNKTAEPTGTEANTVGVLDYVLLSPARDRATRSIVPIIERRGISFARVLADRVSGPHQTRYLRREDDTAATDVDFRFKRFPEVRPEVYASDHCPVFVEVA